MDRRHLSAAVEAGSQLGQVKGIIFSFSLKNERLYRQFKIEALIKVENPGKIVKPLRL